MLKDWKTPTDGQSEGEVEQGGKREVTSLFNVGKMLWLICIEAILSRLAK